MIVTTVFALAIAASTPSNAGRTPVDVLPSAATAPATAAQPATAKKPTVYCIRDTITGSRILRSACRTRAQWLSEGFDPIAPK